MTEVTCPECGAQNPQQSKFCNRCGASFVTGTTHICPSCSTANPINLLYCDNCGTRLVDDSVPTQKPDDDEGDDKTIGDRSKPFSLPTRPPGQTGDLDVSSELPEWLKTGDFSADAGEVEEDDLPWLRAAQEGDPWEDADAPTLEDLSRDHAPQDDLPTWLLDEETADSIFSGEKSTDELFMASSPENGGEEAGEDAMPAELQGWLSDLEGDALQSGGDEDEGDTRSPVPDQESFTAPSGEPQEVEEDDFLRWLSQIQQEASSGQEGVEQPDSTLQPTTLDDFSEGSSPVERGGDVEQESGLEDAEAPDWLLGPSGEEPSAGAFDPHEDDPQEDTPDLLAEPATGNAGTLSGFDYLDEPLPDFGDEQPGARLMASEPAEGGTAGEGVPPTAGGEPDEFLQWLESLEGKEKDLDAEEPLSSEDMDDAPAAIPGKAPAMEFDEDDYELPDWLGTLDDQADQVTAGEDAGLDALPDWLQDLAPPGGEVSLPYVSGVDVELEDELEEHGAMEDTGSESGELEQDTAASELPEWIAAVTTELDEIDAEGDAPEDAAPTFEAQSSWPSDTGESDSASTGLGDQAVTKEDLPDWFSDVLADIDELDEDDHREASQQQLVNVPQQLAGSDLPEWLDSPFIDEAAAEPTPLEEIPEWLRAPLKERLARAAEERGLDETSLGSSDEWRELLEAPLTEEETAPRRVEDAIPAWLASLRSSAQVRGKEAAGVERGTAEGDSPIAGIEGTIGIAPVVARASRRERSATGLSSKEEEQQVLLLRQMARMQEVDKSIAVPAVNGARPLPLATRLLLAALMLAMVAAGLFGGNIWADVTPDAGRSSVHSVMNVILNDGAGQPVLVAFDYTPATAGAMDAAARELLEALAATDRPVLLSSQSATGLALASRAADNSGLLETGDLGLIPGGALGVRRLGHCVQAIPACESLFGQRISPDSLALLAETRNVIVVTAERDALLTWIEQLATTDAVVLSAIVTPTLEPVALPYLASGQLEAIALAEGAQNDEAGTTSAGNVAALSLAQWFVAAATAVGAAYYVLIELIRSRRF